MISTKKNAQYLAAILLERGIHDIIFSPGSRNAPLIQTCSAIKDFRCLNIVDERCAAFFALGMALHRQKPVAIACTSGSATLNYAPAISEAYYQKVPLLILTADRPEEWVDQGDGQTIRQQNIYGNYTKRSCHLTEHMETDDDAWFAGRVINEALNALMYPEMGPVHINIPFKEPLYGVTEKNLPKPKIMTIHHGEVSFRAEIMKSFADVWHSHPRRMILVGQMFYDPELNALLTELSADSSIIILAENLANLQGEKFHLSLEQVLTLISANPHAYRPDLLITCGGAIISKKLKTFLRHYKPSCHWHISPTAEPMDTFMALTDIIPSHPSHFLREFKKYMTPLTSSYGEDWRKLDAVAREKHTLYLRECEFSDLKAFDLIFAHLPDHSILHLSNSSPVRYAQLFKSKSSLLYMSNRGTSGIDGVLSSAAGYAFLSDRINTVIVGDLAFFYDSNALWIPCLPPNLRIILINNGGGGIFRLIDGPTAMEALEEHFEARHTMKGAPLVQAHGLECFVAENEEELIAGLEELYKDSRDKTAVLEIRTSGPLSAETFRQYFHYIKG